MKRLTTDHPEGNFETALNFVYGKDGAAHIRSDGARDDVPLHEWAKMQCIARGCDEFPGETLEEIDETICDCAFDFPGCPVFLAYTFACQAVHLRDRLKMYEDTGLMPEEIKEAQEAMAPISFGRFRDIMVAEREGRILVLPFKLGTEYFSHCHVRNANPISVGRFYPPYVPTLGVNAWLTREEAEAALKEQEG